ncbi:MAG: NAD-dependent epimerase [Verrucomicrobiota bacterium]|nr:NAD-dependent epimerase [Verrucomicrobiota bacterium]
MKILVTGAAGFIGYHLSKKLLERGDSVIGLDNINDYYDTALKYGRLAELGISEDSIEYNKVVGSSCFEKMQFIKLNLEDLENIEKLFENEGFDRVCNLAAQAGVRHSLKDPHTYIKSNVAGFCNILEVCRHNKTEHLVYASSSSVYGLNQNMPFSPHHTTDHPASIYAATKKSNEMMAHSYSHLYRLPTTGLRFFTVYGPWGRPDMALFLFTKAILENKPIKIFNHGDMKRDFTYVDDIVEGVVRIIDSVPVENPNWNPQNPDTATSTAPYKIYNIGNSSPVQLMEFVEAIENSLGRKAEKKLLPLQPGDIKATYADVSDLIEDFNYKPDTSIEAGVKRFVDWYKKFYNIQESISS